MQKILPIIGTCNMQTVNFTKKVPILYIKDTSQLPSDLPESMKVQQGLVATNDFMTIDAPKIASEVKGMTDRANEIYKVSRQFEKDMQNVAKMALKRSQELIKIARTMRKNGYKIIADDSGNKVILRINISGFGNYTIKETVLDKTNIYNFDSNDTLTEYQEDIKKDNDGTISGSKKVNFYSSKMYSCIQNYRLKPDSSLEFEKSLIFCNSNLNTRIYTDRNKYLSSKEFNTKKSLRYKDEIMAYSESLERASNKNRIAFRELIFDENGNPINILNVYGGYYNISFSKDKSGKWIYLKK